jgi:monothiol glutaredoxin
VISDLFAGQTLIKQHQGVMATLADPLANGRLHAVTLKTYTTEQWQPEQPAAGAGLLQIQL